jgi:hypothetical protein
MITCNLMGGLGNQIFQIFTTISYAIKTHNQFKFTNLDKLGNRHTYWDTFFVKLKHFTISVFPKIYIIKENDFTFNELPIEHMMNKDVMLYGYFQSYKYFETNYKLICRIIGLEQMKEVLLQKLNYDFLDNTISLHFRMGDYVNIQNLHPIMNETYYLNCLSYIQSKNKDINYTVMYFCEDSDIECVEVKIKNMSNKFPNYTFIRVDNTLKDWEQLLLMSCCKHNIIANSTFSWWGAYFNSNEDKIVCYPSVWFGPDNNHDTKDLCPTDWINININ